MSINPRSISSADLDSLHDVSEAGRRRACTFWRPICPNRPWSEIDYYSASDGLSDERQIDGMGGAHPLTSKVAIISPSDDDADVDYLFLQCQC